MTVRGGEKVSLKVSLEHFPWVEYSEVVHQEVITTLEGVLALRSVSSWV